MAPRLLIADDNRSFRRYLSQIAEDMGWAVTEAENGAQLVDNLFGAERYDLVFLDILMPEMDGIEAVMRLHGAPRKTPICFVTGESSLYALTARLISESNDFSVIGVLTKPVGIKEVQAIMQSVPLDHPDTPA